MQSHGLARFTSDIDLLVDGTAQEQLVGFMEENGFETLHRSLRYSNHLRAADSARVDFVYVDGSTSARIVGRARKQANSRIPVSAAEHLIAMKLLAMTNDPTRTIAELRDIEHLMAVPDVNLLEFGTISNNTDSCNTSMSSENDWIAEMASRLTPADTDAMRRSREASHRMTWPEYMAFLSANSHLAKVSRKTHAGFEPFKL